MSGIISQTLCPLLLRRVQPVIIRHLSGDASPGGPFSNVVMPEKHRLPVSLKIPTEMLNFPGKIPRGTRESYRILGEEKVHNKLILGQFGIVAIHGGYMTPRHFEVMRSKIGKYLIQGKSFAIYRADQPYKPWTSHGFGKKMGGGKGYIDHYRTPIKAGCVILEVGGKVYWEEVQPWLSRFAKILPFEAIAVNQDLLDRLEAEEERQQQRNTNPYTFEWLVRNNIMDCQTKLSHLDKKYFGRFLYKDRHLNKKWNEVRLSDYKGK